MFEEMRPHTEEEYKTMAVAYRRWALRKMKQGLLRCILVQTKDGEVAGGCGIWLREALPSPGNPSGVRPYLFSVYTEPKFRRSGVASLVVREAMKWCRDRGYARISLHASEMGRRVYARLGWERTWEMSVNLL